MKPTTSHILRNNLPFPADVNKQPLRKYQPNSSTPFDLSLLPNSASKLETRHDLRLLQAFLLPCYLFAGGHNITGRSQE
ncbi:hypothetical protein CEXT_316401 [Caerostris extrusa]|uniref:Uncharacterized protein n=1 Tax=Caerostris extrusa TaxID=172846 RepID=A0AAV4VNJ2_CAEEX|nr:hypothetical protein CEXT_316401 [Caerostris extrusa]